MASCEDTCALSDNPCPARCDNVLVSCDDALSVIIQAILDLAQPQGSLATDIAARVNVICGGTITDAQFANALNFGVSRGALFRRIAAEGTEPTFLVNGYMFKLNPQNTKYMRFPCSSTAFWVNTGS